MQETEAKFYVSDLDTIQRRLHSLGASLIQERILEINLRFDLPDNKLRSEGRVLRLRQDSAARLTYKGASQKQQGALHRTEIEFIVSDFEQAKQFLQALGYQPLFYYEKYRTTYELNGCHIMLDELPYGTFVEIEAESVDSIQGAAALLGLKWERAVTSSYHALFERICAQHAELADRELSFAAFQGLHISMEELSVTAADG